MKKNILLMIILALTFVANVACSNSEATNIAAEEKSEEAVDTVTASSEQVDGVTTASVVADRYRNNYEPNGFTDSDQKKALFVVGDPRKYSVQYDMTYTAMKHFEEKGIEVELRDLYDMDWNPVLSAEEFYYQKDGKGTVPEDVKVEQDLVTQADYIIFSYPNWHDTPNVMVKGYMERVFASQFAYTNEGPEGLLVGKGMYTISNCGFLGGGRGFVGDGVGINDDLWDEYMEAFRVFDEDTAGWWGMENLGRFMNDRTPANDDENYETEMMELRNTLINHLDTTFF
ncbi:NAD(P)H-dependent oxidoreductase [Tindallia californiensis]|uniref:Flavodoxin-like fold n=1 Tax=Tindallia californiensis TaxID=159292 RepID=A0A1H3QQJ4_9FIRM|nr:NAD(P)H-dependent oxidoreductase [Tindallia californiensis]SDZ15667.1 Flavodoxin-like fold [Tindallia californiensis]